MSKVIYEILYLCRCFFAGAGVLTIMAVNLQPWHMVGGILAKKLGVIVLFLDISSLWIVGPIFKVLAYSGAGIMSYGLYFMCQFLECALLFNWATAGPTLWLSAGAAFVMDFALNGYTYPPIALTSKTWMLLTSGRGIPVDYGALFMLLVSVLSMETSTRFVWYPLIKRRNPWTRVREESKQKPIVRPKRFRRRKRKPKPVESDYEPEYQETTA